MRVLILIFVITLLVESCNSNDRNNMLEFEHEINFGKIIKGTNKTKQVQFVNKGDQMIYISSIGTSCSCSSSDKKSIILKPHSKGTIALNVFMDSTKNEISEIFTLKQEKPLKFHFIQVVAKSR